MISLGCDIGAIATKTVILKGDRLAAFDVTLNDGKLADAARRSVLSVLGQAGLDLEEIPHFGGTGWGEKYISFPHSVESSIRCLARGAYWSVPAVRTVVDIGGLSTTIISVDGKNGKAREYRTNDRCASGTGFFLDLAAQALELKVEELGPVSLAAGGRAHISAQCAVFGESEIVTHVNEGAEPADIAAGIVYSIGTSVATMVLRLGAEKEIVATGGVAKNKAVIKALEEKLGLETVKLDVDSQIIGAIGAALNAQARNAE
ncbi:MAG: 2-hydroxyglutaryl-CoA dehydratase [Deltaproteobacteria bacterium]|nr:2-hydroxyglutaryl-CoA dehydratase [Deltaproteobacteria bacterium]